VLFSSHILSDAEQLCSRVGILAKGRLVASGSVNELTASGAKGWELVVSDLSDEAANRFKPRTRRMTRIAEGRYSIDLDAHIRPEPMVAELAATGAALVSVTPLRMTLEDVFVTATGAGQ
jgi:ABC-2 type transport system ATP-binding protein